VAAISEVAHILSHGRFRESDPLSAEHDKINAFGMTFQEDQEALNILELTPKADGFDAGKEHCTELACTHVLNMKR